MEKNLKLKSILKLAIVVIIALCAMIIFAMTNKVNAYDYTSARAVRDYNITLTNGSSSRYRWKIVSGDSENYTTFCLQGGGRLGSKYETYYNVTNIFNIAISTLYFNNADNQRSAMWLLDNAYITTTDADTKAYLKENLLNQITDANVKAAFNRLTDEEIVTIENCILWNYSRNIDSFHKNVYVAGNDAKVVFDYLKALADTNKNYTGHNNATAEITTGSNFTINTETGKAGPFTSNVDLTTDNIKVYVNSNEVTNFTISGNTTAGFNITVPTSSLKTGSEITNNIVVKYKGIKTTAYMLTKANHQNLVTLTKSLVSVRGKASDTTPKLELDLALVKTISSYKHNGSETETYRFDPQTDVSIVRLDNNSSTDATYSVHKSPLRVQKGDTITYRIYVFNEGDVDANAQICDYIPAGLTLVNTNEWTKAEADIIISGVRYTKITSNSRTKVLKAHTPGNDLDYAYMEVVCTVDNTAQKDDIYRNYAEISAFKHSTNGVTEDRDSQVKNMSVKDYVATVIARQDWSGISIKSSYDQQDDDDFEQIIIKEPGFDLALRKYISQINDEAIDREPYIYGKYNSTVLADTDTMVEFLKSEETTFEYEHDKTTLEVSKGDFITYTIRVYNEGLGGDYNGYASYIIDNLPEGLELDATKTAAANLNNNYTVEVNSQATNTINIIANDEGIYDEDFETVNVMKYYTDKIIGTNSSYYQEVNVVCKVTEEAAVDTVLMNVASIYEYKINKGTDANDNILYNEVFSTNEGNAILLDRDSTVSSLETDSVTSIRAAAGTKLANYVPEHELYVPGLQDDDDFESVIVREVIQNEYQFNVKKVQAVSQGSVYGGVISGISIVFDDAEEAIITDNWGNAQLMYTDATSGETTENIPVDPTWLPNVTNGTAATIRTTKIEELQTSTYYVPLAAPVYAYYTFTEEGNVDEVKISTTLYEGQDLIDNFAGLTQTVTATTASNGTVSVEISKDENSITVKIPNPIMTGIYNLVLKKVDAIGNAIEGIGIVVNNKSEVETNEYGIATYTETLSATGQGWTYNEFEETDVVSADGTTYVKLQAPIRIYKYTEIVNYTYKVTKIGFGMEEGEYKEFSTEQAQQLEKDVVLEDGRTVTLKLSIPQDTGSVVSATLEIQNLIPEGQYELKIKKIDQNENPIQGVTFSVDGQTTTATGTDGIVSLGTKTISDLGIDSYAISEINIGNDYIKFDGTINVKVMKMLLFGKYRAIHTYFDNDGSTRKKTVQLADGTEVQLKLSIDDGVITLTIPNKKVYFDLALQKFITGVNDTAVTNRIPSFSTVDGKYVYTPEFDDLSAVEVANSDIVTYTIRVYNEGERAGYASEIMDDIPEGLQFVSDSTVNSTYGWVMYREVEEGETPNAALTRTYNGKTYVVTDDTTKADIIRTEYLSKESGEDRMAAGETTNPNLLTAFVPATMQSPDYRDVKVQFKVKYEVTSIEDTARIIINYAQITDDSDENGDDINDKDSTPNEWIDTDDDQDREKIKVKYFDLALVKWVSEAIVIENGKETVYEGNKETDIPEPTVKVDLKKSKIDDVVVKFKYQIKVTNQGEIAGYVKELSDYIPQGLKFVAADNTEFGWEEAEGKVVTNYLSGTLLQPGESATVTIVLTWINSEDNLGLKINVAEISKDYNEEDDTPDIDSTPDNQVEGEDDIDDAPVMLAITTGESIVTTYVILGLSVTGLIAIGTILIKKYVM